MMRIQFKGKDVATGREVEGDLAWVHSHKGGQPICEPYIVTHARRGGMFYITARYKVDPDSIQSQYI